MTTLTRDEQIRDLCVRLIHGEDYSDDEITDLCDLALQGLEQRGAGTPSARLDWILDALAMRFPHAHSQFASNPCEPKYIAEIDKLIAQNAAGRELNK